MCSDSIEQGTNCAGGHLGRPFFWGKASSNACHCEPVLTLAWQSASPLPRPMGEVPRKGRRGRFLPSQSLRDSSPKVGAKGTRRTDCHTSVATLVRNDLRHFKRAYCLYDRRSLLIPQRKTGDFLGVFPIEKGKWVWYTDSRIWKKKVFL